MGSSCDNLDAFLLGDLGRDEAAHFERHLGTCSACREAIDGQRWIDGLLQWPARADLEPAPEAIVKSIQVSIDRRRKRQRTAVGGLAVAAALAVAAGWTLWARVRPQQPAAGQVALSPSERMAPQETGGSPAARPQAPGAEPQSPERITKAVVVGDENTIVVPVESRYPNVTVVRVYPEYRPKHVAQTEPGQPTDGDGFDLPQSINGG